MSSACENLPLVDAFLATKARDGVGIFHLRDLRSVLRRFAQTFPKSVMTAARADIYDWLDALGVGPVGWNNALRRLAVFFSHLRSRRVVPRDWDELPMAKRVRPTAVEIFTVEEMRLLLGAAPERLIPLLVLGAFAGLRLEETRRVCWEHFHWSKGLLMLRRDLTKTRTARAVPILPNVKTWLAPWGSSSGSVYRGSDPWRERRRLAAAVGIQWKRNALRHSYGSYRLAACPDLARVSMEMGNSPNIVRTHYQELVSEEAAAAWFGITPDDHQGILPLEFKGRAA